MSLFFWQCGAGAVDKLTKIMKLLYKFETSTDEVEVEPNTSIAALKKEIWKNIPHPLNETDAALQLTLVRVLPPYSLDGSVSSKLNFTTILKRIEELQRDSVNIQEDEENRLTLEYKYEDETIPGFGFSYQDVITAKNSFWAKVMNPSLTCSTYGLNRNTRGLCVDIIVIAPPRVFPAGRGIVDMEVDLKRFPFEETISVVKNIINMMRHQHTDHFVDPLVIQQFQSGKMGRFYKPIPYGTTATNVILPLMGKLFNGTPTTHDGRSLEEIVDQDRTKTVGHYVVAMVGRSGAGKTATVMDVAKKHFVIYFICSDPNSMKGPDYDLNFDKMARYIENLFDAFPKPQTIEDVLNRDRLFKKQIQERVRL
ncbi:hypothetical protein HK096_006955, partial [Nowakowskiella sp. JEL0078]